MDRILRLTASTAALTVMLASLRGQVPGNTELAPNAILRTIPPAGAVGVAPDRDTSLFFGLAIDPATVTAQSMFATVGQAPLAADLLVSLSQRVVTLDYRFFLPGNAAVVVTVDGELLRDVYGRPVDADGDGLPGGKGSFRFDTGPAKPLPVGTGPAVLTGYVFDTSGRPLSGAVVRGWRFPRKEHEPPLPVPNGVSDPSGFFTYTTIPFTGTEEFLIEITRADHSETLVRAAVLANGCQRLRDARLEPLGPPQTIQASQGGSITDPTGRVTLAIPPGALQQTSDIRVTVLRSSATLREELPELVGEGTFVDINGVFGEATNAPVTLQVPNVHGLPPGTRVPFGKVDHNTLQWADLRDLYRGPPPIPDEYLGTVKQRQDGSTFVEIRFDQFCSICTGYCLPFPPPDGPPPPPGPPPPDPPGCDPGNSSGNSTIDVREGALREELALPAFAELERGFVLTLGYCSTSADPSVTLQQRVDFHSTRPVERTLFRFEVEGVLVEAAYGFTDNGRQPVGTFLWNGSNGLGQRLPTGTYPYTARVTTLNALTAVALPAAFGQAAAGPPSATTFPGLTRLRTPDLCGRAVLIDLRDSPFGAGWRLVEAPRLWFDADGCLLLISGNSRARRYVPDPATPNAYSSQSWDASRLALNPATGGFLRTSDDGSREEYDAGGRILRQADRFGLTTVFTWSGDRIVRVASPTGHRVDFVYDGAGKLSAATDSAGRTTSFQVDANGDLVTMTDATGATRRFRYDGAHRLVEQIGARGERSTYSYRQGRVVEALAFDTDGTTLLRRRTFEPGVLQGEIGQALTQGLGTLANPIGIVDRRIDRTTDGRDARAEHHTDDAGRTVLWRDGLGRETRYTYHPDGRAAGWQNPDGSGLEFDYDAGGNRSEVRQKSTTTTVAATERFEYQGPFARPSRIVDAENKETRFVHDVLGRLIAERDHDGNQTVHEYRDARFPNLPTRTIEPLGIVREMAFDAHGNIVSVTTFADPATRPAGERIVVTRDPAGLIAAVTNPSGETTSYQRDALGNVTRITDHLQNAIQLDYGVAGCGCATGNVTKVTYPNGTTIAFEYDGLDRLRRRTDRLGRTSLWTHDPEGSVLTWQNRNGETVRYGYDLLGRLVRKELPGNEVVTFAYDLAGNLASAADPFCVLELQHDAFHRLTQATTLLELPIGTGAPQTLAHTLGYTYDRVGNRTAMVDSFGVASLAYTYDDLHRPRTVSRATDPSQRWSFAYDAAGRRTTTTIAKSGVVTTDLWDRARNLVARVAQTAPAAGVATVHDPSGRANAETRVLGPVPETWAFAYDGAGRLTAAAATALFGDTRVSRTHTYDVDGRLRSDGEYDYTFDPEGRLVQRGRIGSTLTDRYTYDAEGRQRSHVQTFDSGTGPVTLLTVRYCHDPLGRRIAKDVNGVTTRYVHDRDDVLHEVDLLNRVERSYVHGSGVDEHLAVLDAVTGRVLHVHQDRLGSVVALSDDSGALVQRYRYDEFGNLIGESDPSLFFAFAFTGRERDDETGWYHLRARAYDPRIGRFLREDPLGTDGGFNLYAYVENDPINLTDPFGLQSSNPFDLCSPCEPVCRLATTPGTADPQMAMECNRCRERCRKLQKCTPGECLKAYSIFGLVFCVARAAPRCVME